MTLNDFETLIADAATSILGIPESDVRISWPTKGAPAWGIEKDIVFIRCSSSDGPYNRLKDVRYQNSNDTTSLRTETYTRIMRVDFILYGPNSFDYADIIRNSMGRYEALTKNNVFLIYDRPAPTRSPELYNGQWWERSDLALYFNEQIAREDTVNNISGVSVTIKTEGDERNVNITT